jgi:hypothetical protein
MSRYVFVQNAQRPFSISPRVRYCDSFLCQLRGLMFRRSLDVEEGLLLVQPQDGRLASAIHMLFVPFPLAVFWLDSQLRVVDKVLAQPWRPAYFPRQPARYVLELHPAYFLLLNAGESIVLHDA